MKFSIDEQLLRNEEYLRVSKIANWIGIKRFTKRNVHPTDIDTFYESNRCFLIIEFKTIGAEMQYGQELAMIRALEEWRRRDRCYFFLCTHDPILQVVTPLKLHEIKTVSVWRWMESELQVCKTPPGKLNDWSSLARMVEAWQDQADGREDRLGPWFERQAVRSTKLVSA